TVVYMEVRDGDVRGPGGGRDGAPRRIAPLRMLLLAVEIERGLARLHVGAGRGEQGEARFGQPPCKRCPHRSLLAGERAAAVIKRTKAAGKELVAVDQH